MAQEEVAAGWAVREAAWVVREQERAEAAAGEEALARLQGAQVQELALVRPRRN
jgi:hypothetical protein